MSRPARHIVAKFSWPSREVNQFIYAAYRIGVLLQKSVTETYEVLQHVVKKFTKIIQLPFSKDVVIFKSRYLDKRVS